MQKKKVSSRSIAAVTAAAVGVSAFVVPNATAADENQGATIGAVTIGGATINGDVEETEEKPDIIKASLIGPASKISTPASESAEPSNEESTEPTDEDVETSGESEGSENSQPDAPKDESPAESKPDAPKDNTAVALKDEDLEYKTFDSLNGVEFAVQSRPISDMGDQSGEDGKVAKVTWYRVDYRNLTDEVARGAKLYHTASAQAFVSNMIEHSHFGNTYPLKPTYDPKFDTDHTKSFFMQPGDIKPGGKGYYEFIVAEVMDKDANPEDLSPIIFSDGTKENVLGIAQADAISIKDLPEFFADGKSIIDKPSGKDDPKETSVNMSTADSAAPSESDEPTSEEPTESEEPTSEAKESDEPTSEKPVEPGVPSTTKTMRPTEQPTESESIPLIPLEPARPITTVVPTPTEKLPKDDEDDVSTSEEPTSEVTSTKETSTVESSTEKTSTAESTSEEPTSEVTSTEETSTAETSTAESTSKATSTEKTSTKKTSTVETTTEKKPVEPGVPSTTKMLRPTEKPTESEKPSEGTRPVDKDSSSQGNAVVKWFGGLPDVVQLLIYLLSFIGAGAAIGWFTA